MMTVIKWICLIGLGIILDSTAQEYKRFCYVASWARYRKDMAFNPENIRPNLCTHITYCFAKLHKSGTKLIAADPGDDPVMYKRFNDIKKTDRNLKTLISVGGWQSNSRTFSQLAASNTKIRTFSRNVIKFLRSRGFDGIDLDWEFPGIRGSVPEDKRRFTRLVMMLRMAFNQEARYTRRDRLLVTAALGPSQYQISLSYQPVKLARSLDMINLMTYDMHGLWDLGRHAFHHAALYGRPADKTHNVDYMATHWTNLGVPKEKIMIGIPFHSRTYTVATGSNAVSGLGKAGNFTKEKGVLAYYEVCKMLKTGGTGHVIDSQKVPYLTVKNQWVGYDDEKSLTEKVNYVVNNGYGGVMVWALDLDDFKGVCGKRYPLINAVRNAFTLDVRRQPFRNRVRNWLNWFRRQL